MQILFPQCKHKMKTKILFSLLTLIHFVLLIEFHRCHYKIVALRHYFVVEYDLLGINFNRYYAKYVFNQIYLTLMFLKV
jgi:hypothetical protein